MLLINFLQTYAVNLTNQAAAASEEEQLCQHLSERVSTKTEQNVQADGYETNTL
jgi:hypothetical protein